MDREEEYRSLLEELEQTPAALEGTVVRAGARARRRKKLRLLELPAISLAGVCAAFVLLVNLSTPFALACGRIPALRNLTAAAALSPSLKAAVQHDYVQYIGLEQSSNGITMSVDFVIVDQKQVNVFYTAKGPSDTVYSVEPDVTALDGERLEGYAIYSGDTGENGSLQKVVIDFVDGNVPRGLRLTCRLIPRETRSEARAFQDTENASAPSASEPAEPDFAAVFTFDLGFDPEYTETGETIALNRWFELDGQRLLARNVEIYPTHIRLNLGDDETNTAWLRSLEFYLEDENGSRYEKISSGISATGSTDSYFMAGHRLESSYFGDAEHLTIQITGATWLEKDLEYVQVNLKTGQAGRMPGWMRLEQVERLGENRYSLSVSAPCTVEGHYYQLLRWDYLDEQGTELSFNEKGSTGVDNNADRFEERVVLKDYPYDTVRLGLSVTREITLEQPVEIPVK